MTRWERSFDKHTKKYLVDLTGRAMFELGYKAALKDLRVYLEDISLKPGLDRSSNLLYSIKVMLEIFADEEVEYAKRKRTTNANRHST